MTIRKICRTQRCFRAPGRGVLLCLLLAAAVWEAPAALAADRDAERCRSRTNLESCYDAVRRSPRDPTLLVAWGDALQRANRPAEAVRAYRRAAALAPSMRGVAAKIAAAEAKESAARAPAAVAVNRAAPVKRPSNTDPVGQSH